MSATHDAIFDVLKAAKAPLTMRDIVDEAQMEGQDALYSMALHSLSQPGGPLVRTRHEVTGRYMYSMRPGITRESFRAPSVKRKPKPAADVQTPAPPKPAGLAPSKPVTNPAPLRADEVTRKASEAPAGVSVRRVSPMDNEPKSSASSPTEGSSGTAGAPSVQPEKPAEGSQQPNTTTSQQSANENPGGGAATTPGPREAAPKAKPQHLPETHLLGRIAELQLELVRVAVCSSDPVVASVGNRLDELQSVLRTINQRERIK